MITHKRDRLVGADARLGADRKIDRPETVGPAINKVAEKDDHPRLDKFGFTRSLVDQRADKIASSVNVADSEDLRFPAPR